MLRLAVTPGDPAGIGPELLPALIKACPSDVQLVVFADPQLLKDRGQLELPRDEVCGSDDRAVVREVVLATAAQPGQPDARNAGYVLDSLNQAVSACLSGELTGLVTGPVHKGIINESGMRFSGHTELLAERAGVDEVVMMLACPGLRVTLATTHLPLRAVPDAITQDLLLRKLAIIDADLRRLFGLSRPHIAVCGLNPHAGEGGHMGREEIDVIEPALSCARERGLNVSGPWPADTLFTPPRLAECDAVLAMYHDQGLPVLKHLGFGRAVNVTLGLPFIRTSVDHGTAFDLAGTGRADAGSFIAALNTAIEMARHEH